MERGLLPHGVEETTAKRRPRDAAQEGSALQRHVLELQRSAGNAAVAQAVARTKKTGGAAAVVLGPKKTVKMKKTKPKVVVPPRPQRIRRVPNAVDHEINWSGPAYGSVDSVAGGDSVSADLGPAAGQATNYGSVPGTDQCTAVNQLNAVNFQAKPWIKGHLLNDNLGGPGLSKNLTPLTHNANMAYKNAVETKVKNALTVCYSLGQRSHTHWYGVRFAANTTGKTWAVPANVYAGHVAQTLDAAAEYIAKPRAGGPAVALGGKPTTTAPDLPGPGVVTTNCFQ